MHVTWAASPSTGVAGYQVDRRVSGGPWQPLDASAPAGGIVDQTAPNGQAVDYRVSAITAGVQPTLLSVSSTPGSAVPDAIAPDLPNEVTPPDFVNQGNENAVPVKVFLPQTSAPTDVVSVTLTNPTTGDSASATTAGGQSPVSVNIDASQIPDGMLNVDEHGDRRCREHVDRLRPDDACPQGHDRARRRPPTCMRPRS